MAPDIVVHQSTESSSDFLFDAADLPVKLTFLSSTKGRMEFSAEVDGEPKGKVNVLSQHSIARLAKSSLKDEELKGEFTTTMLKAGVILREGTYVVATMEDKTTAEVMSLEGESSTYGDIDPTTIGKFLGERFLLDRINEVLHESRETPFVGDDANLLLTFLVFLSCKTDNPLNLEMIGQSSSGKTYMTLTARNGFPKSMIMVLAGASKEALKYDYDEVDEDGNFIVNVDGRCIVVLEKRRIVCVHSQDEAHHVGRRHRTRLENAHQERVIGRNRDTGLHHPRSSVVHHTHHSQPKRTGANHPSIDYDSRHDCGESRRGCQERFVG